MQDTSAASPATWELPPVELSGGRRSAGRALIIAATAALAIVVGLQVLETLDIAAVGFATWRPVAYA